MGREWAKVEAAMSEPVGEKKKKGLHVESKQDQNMNVSSRLFSLQEKSKLISSRTKF